MRVEVVTREEGKGEEWQDKESVEEERENKSPVPNGL